MLRRFLLSSSLTTFPKSNGSVRLGPNGREFGVSMFRQLECLETIRQALVYNAPDARSEHCLNFLRQAVLCASDLALDPLIDGPDVPLNATDGVGVTHVCRDWTRVYAYVSENQKGAKWLD